MQKKSQTTRFNVRQKVKTVFAMKIRGSRKRKTNNINNKINNKITIWMQRKCNNQQSVYAVIKIENNKDRAPSET